MRSLITRIMIVDDDRHIREALRAMLDHADYAVVIGVVQSGEDAVRKAGELKPDVIIMDVKMPGIDGPRATAQIKQALPDTQILALSVSTEPAYVRAMIASGASGYVLKARAHKELLFALSAVTAGNVYLSPSITSDLLSLTADPLA